jgi:asparagine synthase (glutamine-hydrolysing)
MCGIAGVLAQDSRDAMASRVGAMLSVVGHRGPDDSGVDVWPVGPPGWYLGIGHRRLSILDLSPAGHQPMCLGDSLLVTYNGEIYNYLELKARLKALGHVFHTGTDTEVLLHGYDEWGEKCLAEFNGMWSFALWDSRRGRLFCAVDRSGIKPFHYATAQGQFALASEIKSLLEVPWVGRQVNRAVAGLFLLSGVDGLDDCTFFRDVTRLRAGHALRLVPGGSPEVFRWWDPVFQEPPAKMAEVAEQVRHLVRDSIRLRYRSDVPVGIALSGGIDSTGLVCNAADMAKRGELTLENGLRTFTATATGVEAVDEGPVALRVARHAGAEAHTVQPCGADLLAGDLDRLVFHQEEPFSNLSTYMQFRVMRLARETGTVVMLSGQGPDELFWGYPWQYPYAWMALVRALKPLAALREVAGALRNGTVGPTALAGYLAYGLSPGLRRWRYGRRTGPFLSPGVIDDEVHRLFEAAAGTADESSLLRREVERVGLPALLRYEDRNSMAFSVESRLPYLDHRLLELAYSLPAWQRIHDGWSKVILRQANESVTPAGIVWRRRKIGFSASKSHFMASLVPLVQDVFSGPTRSAAFLDGRAIVAAFRSVNTDMTLLWRFLCFELWMRRFLVEI